MTKTNVAKYFDAEEMKLKATMVASAHVIAIVDAEQLRAYVAFDECAPDVTDGSQMFTYLLEIHRDMSTPTSQGLGALLEAEVHTVAMRNGLPIMAKVAEANPARPKFYQPRGYTPLRKEGTHVIMTKPTAMTNLPAGASAPKRSSRYRTELTRLIEKGGKIASSLAETPPPPMTNPAETPPPMMRRSSAASAASAASSTSGGPPSGQSTSASLPSSAGHRPPPPRKERGKERGEAPPPEVRHSPGTYLVYFEGSAQQKNYPGDYLGDYHSR